jgi:hypothetical protein
MSGCVWFRSATGGYVEVEPDEREGILVRLAANGRLAAAQIDPWGTPLPTTVRPSDRWMCAAVFDTCNAMRITCAQLLCGARRPPPRPSAGWSRRSG